MTTKEAGKRAGGAATGKRSVRQSSALRELLLPFGLSLALSRAVVLGDSRSLSLGWVAAAGTGVRGTAALAGALLGYVAFLPTAPALRCCAAAILMYTLALSCCELRVFRRSWFLAACVGVITALTGLVYQSGALWSVELALHLASESLLSCGVCLLLRAGAPEEGQGLGRGMAVLWTVLGSVSLAGLHPGLGSTAAALATLLSARLGPGAGALVGAATGLSVGLGREGTPLLGAVLGVSGALAGLRRERHRLEPVLLFTGSALAAALWSRAGGLTALSCTVAAVIYSALPEGVLRRLEALEPPRVSAPVHRFSAQELAGARLEAQSRAYQSLCAHLRQSLEAEEPAEESAVIFERTMERVCPGCFLYPVCWQRDYAETCRGLTQVLERMLEAGGVSAADYPEGFRRRCGRLEEFLRVSNEELYGHWARLRSRERLRESRRAVCGQYEQLARLLRAAADQLREEVEEDRTGAASVHRALEAQGLETSCVLQVDQRGRRTLEVRGPGLTGLDSEAGVRLLSGALGVRMEPTTAFRVRRGEQMVFHQCPPLSATVAVASHSRREGQANGDNGLWFRDEEGMLWVALCDGMGSGAAASRDSRLLSALLRDFLRAGVSPAGTLRTLSGALGLAGELDGGFTTVDLLRLDLFSGAGELYKLGGAPTYLRRGGLVSRLTADSLPAGLEGAQPGAPDEHHFRLDAGDDVLLLTDGVTDGQEDQWLRAVLERYEGPSARELAQRVLSGTQTQGEDDRTVVAVRVSRRVTPP